MNAGKGTHNFPAVQTEQGTGISWTSGRLLALTRHAAVVVVHVPVVARHAICNIQKYTVS